MTSLRAEFVAAGIPFGEGPVWCDDGTLVVTSVAGGALYRVHPGTRRTERFADTAGGPNGAALASDGSFLVTQNGGIDFSAYGLFDPAPPFRPVPPGLQLVSPAGEVTDLAATGCHAPNDLVVTGDGTVLFTDPGHFPPSSEDGGRIVAYSPDGTVRVYAGGFFYCNGIALDRDGHVVVVERQGLQRVFPDGSREWVVEHLGPGGGDGFCFDVDGNAYVASTAEHGVRVVDPGGAVVDFLPIDGTGITTNCCFGGDDMRTLFATDAVPGAVVAWDRMPVAGVPLHRWPARA